MCLTAPVAPKGAGGLDQLSLVSCADDACIIGGTALKLMGKSRKSRVVSWIRGAWINDEQRICS